MVKTRIAVFVSGGGTNLQALLDAEKSGALISGEIVLVISDLPSSASLAFDDISSLSSWSFFTFNATYIHEMIYGTKSNSATYMKILGKISK